MILSDSAMKTATCQICGQPFYQAQLIPATAIRDSILESIHEEHPGWSDTGYICLSDLNHFRTSHIEAILTRERGELSAIEREVAQTMADEELISQDVNAGFTEKLPLGARIADKVASFGGSWRFIILFGLFIMLWIMVNSVLVLFGHFDPFPFILLNLILSCLAAIQAPVIMMSQNRQEVKDRLRSEHDYKVNLKAELEIRHISDKLDHLINRQWQGLLETQQVLMDMVDEYAKQVDSQAQETRELLDRVSQAGVAEDRPTE
jgi:uncharacterized membrane protein